MQPERLLVALLQALHYFLQLQQSHLRGGVVGNPKKFSSTFLVGVFSLKFFSMNLVCLIDSFVIISLCSRRGSGSASGTA